MDPAELGALDWASTDDPLAVLIGEHHTILTVLDEVEREARRVELQRQVREAFWEDVLRFSDEFDRGLHHQKEEALLFPALEAAGLSPVSGPTAVLRDEHLRSHYWRQRIEQALRVRDRVRLCVSATSYVDLMRAHVLKENQILFPLARRLLRPEQLQTLHREFRLLAADQRAGYWMRHPYEQPAGA
jgi:hemerythrin-like domain-containing protein